MALSVATQAQVSLPFRLPMQLGSVLRQRLNVKLGVLVEYASGPRLNSKLLQSIHVSSCLPNSQAWLRVHAALQQKHHHQSQPRPNVLALRLLSPCYCKRQDEPMTESRLFGSVSSWMAGSSSMD